MKTINIIDDRAGLYVVTIRGGKVRRHRNVTPSSLQRVRGLLKTRQVKQRELSKG